MNFLLGSGISSSDSFRNIVLSQSAVLTSKSYILLGSKLAFPSIFDLSTLRHLQVSPLQISGLSMDSLGTRTIAFGGDFNDDHLPELLIGSPLSSKVYIVYSGRANREWSNVTDYSVLTGKRETSSGLGWAVSSAGDFNKDGIEDILISAIYSNKVYLVKGKTSLNISRSTNIEDFVSIDKQTILQNGWTFMIRKDPLMLSFGVAVSTIKDYNGDTYDDIVISALGNNGANRIFIVLGGSAFSSSIIFLNDPAFSESRVITIFASSFSFAGLSLSGVGDMNGDGLGDLLIGSIPYNKGYSTQQSYLLYGSRSSSTHIFLSNFTSEGKGSVIKGGGFAVNGIGDINNDGYDDMMITSYNEWQGKIGSSYMMVFPTKQQWISNIPSFVPSSSPSSAVVFPTSFPSTELPTSLPSFLTSSPTSFPSFRNTSSSRSPTYYRSVRPSRIPTLVPSLFPTLITTVKPSRFPSDYPSHTLSPSFIPSISSTTNLPTKKPSFKPSSSHHPSASPTSHPSLSASSQGRTVSITSGGSYEGGNGEENLVISSKKDVTIKGNQGKKHFIISSIATDYVTITILDFKSEEGDVLDFSQLDSTSYSYSTNPLTFVFSSLSSSPSFSIRVILSSHSDYDLNPENVIFPSSSSSSLSSSSSSSSSFKSMKLTSPSRMFMTVICLLFGLFVILALMLNYNRRVSRLQREKNKPSHVDISNVQGSSLSLSYSLVWSLEDDSVHSSFDQLNSEPLLSADFDKMFSDEDSSILSSKDQDCMSLDEGDDLDYDEDIEVLSSEEYFEKSDDLSFHHYNNNFPLDEQNEDNGIQFVDKQEFEIDEDSVR
jgi:hypothetical protein